MSETTTEYTTQNVFSTNRIIEAPEVPVDFPKSKNYLLRKEFIMIDRILNELASVSLEVLKLRVLFVLYEAKERTGCLNLQEIRQQLGIPPIMSEPAEHESFVFALLCYLEDEEKVRRMGEDRNYWRITAKGVSAIKRGR